MVVFYQEADPGLFFALLMFAIIVPCILLSVYFNFCVPWQIFVCVSSVEELSVVGSYKVGLSMTFLLIALDTARPFLSNSCH